MSKEGKRLASAKGAREGKELRSGPQKCTACVTSDPAVTYCQQCSEYLCSDCKKSHQRQHKTKDHSLIDAKMSDSVRANANIHCQQHSGEMITKFCLTCNDIACQMCVTTNHKTHKVTNISECEDKVYNLCLDKMKTLQGPFVKIKAETKNITKNRKDFSNKCDTIEKEIIQRKTALVSMITNIADKAVSSVRSTKKEVESIYSNTETQLDKVLKDCETVTTLLGMGIDINNIVKRILFITTETQEANSVLSTVDFLEKSAVVKLDGNNLFSDIEANTKKYFGVKLPDVNTHVFAMTRPTATPVSMIMSPVSGSSPAAKQPDTSCRIPNKLQLVNKTQTDHYYYTSKHVPPESFIANFRGSRTVNRLSYTSDGKVDIMSQYTPESLKNHGRNILTIGEDRHVIISENEIHLCDNSKVIRSVPHSADGYIPAVIGFYDQQKFVTVCEKQKKMRYYDVNALSIISTHSLSKDLHLNASVLCTSTGEIMLNTGNKELTKFTAEGLVKATVPINDEYFECQWLSKCMDKYNTIFGVREADKTVLAFGLRGEHKVVGKIDDLIRLWGAGVDKDQHLYVSYSTGSSKFVAQYKY